MSSDLRDVENIISRKIASLTNDVVRCVVALEPRFSANNSKFSPVQSDALRSEEREYVEEIGPQFFEEKQKLAAEIRTLEEKKTIQLKLLKQFEARAEAWLKKCDPELINLLNKDMEKRRALIDNIEQRIEENKKCISLVEEQEVKLGTVPSTFVLARNPTNTDLVTFVPPEKMANNGQRFFAFKAPKNSSMAVEELMPSSNLIPTPA